MSSSHDTPLRAVAPRGGSLRSRPSSAGYLVGLVLVAILIGVMLGRAVGPRGDTPLAGSAGLIEQMQAQVEARPDDVVAWQRLGEAHLELGMADDDTDRYLAADQAFLRVEDLSPGHPGSARGRALVALGLHRFDAAVDLAAAAHASRPNDPVALRALIDAEIEMGLYDQAQGHLQTLLDLRPDASSLSRLSYLRQFRGDDDGARSAMVQAGVAAEGSPAQQVRIDVLLGEVLVAQGRLDEADAVFAEALVPSSPRDPAAQARLEGAQYDAYIGQARVAAARGDLDTARAVLEPTVQREWTEKGAMLLTELHLAAGDDGAAQAQFEQFRTFVQGEVAKGFGIDSEVPLFLASFGDPAYGLELARAVDAVRPDSTHAAQALAWALLRSGQPDRAVEPIGRALRLGTNDARLQYMAAEIFDAVGQPGRAAEHLRTSLAINPAFSPGLAADVEALAARLGVSR